MLNKIPMLLIAALFALPLLRPLFAETAETTQVVSNKAVDAGNKVCPVGNEKVNDKIKATYEYQGKIYNFCCPMCIEDFKSNPQKYIEKVENELKERKAEQEAPEHDAHAGHHH